MIWQKEIQLPPYERGFHLITRRVEAAIDHWPPAGMLHVFIQHTSAGITINENADPSVRVDFESVFNHLVPEGLSFLTHTLEGPDDMPAHIKAALIGHSVSIPIVRGRLHLGTWQGVYLCEFRNQAAGRQLILTIYS